MIRNRSRFVTELRPEEAARFNPQKLEDLCRRIGEARAEAEVARALERISAVLVALPEMTGGNDGGALHARLTSLTRDAELIGMATLARVARHVLDCIERGDRLALSATSARLARVGDRSIHAVWDLEDLSG